MPVPTTTASVIRPLYRDRAYEQIRSWILDGVCAPGERLHPKEIQQHLGTSMQPISLALDRLTVQGLVVTHPHRNTAVARPTRSEGLEAADALRWIATALPDDDTVTARALDALDVLLEDGGAEQFTAARRAFEAVYDGAANTAIAETLRRDLDRVLYTAQFAAAPAVAAVAA